MPTDTVYGLSGRAFSHLAFQTINRLKNRPPEKRLILLVAHFEMLQRYVSVSLNVIEQLKKIQRPTTVIYSNVKKIPNYLRAPDGSIAIRVVQNTTWLSQFIDEINEPILSTSANLSGQKTPTLLMDVNPSIQKQVDFILKDQRNEPNNRTSQIIRFTEEHQIQILRD